MVPLSMVGVRLVDLFSLQDGKGQPWLAGPIVHKPSHRGVAVLAPVTQAQVAGLGEHTVPDGATVAKGDNGAACSVGGSLESLAAQLALGGEGGLAGGEVEQPLSTVAANHLGLADGALGNSHGDHGGDAGAGETVRHGSRVVVGASLAPVFKL